MDRNFSGKGDYHSYVVKSPKNDGLLGSWKKRGATIRSRKDLTRKEKKKGQFLICPERWGTKGDEKALDCL